MKKTRTILTKITSKFSKFSLFNRNVAADNGVLLPKKENRSVPPPEYSLKELLANIPELNSSDRDATVLDSDVPPPKKETEPVPPPVYTFKELLANIPEQDAKVSKSCSSEEVDTGKVVGKEVW